MPSPQLRDRRLAPFREGGNWSYFKEGNMERLVFFPGNCTLVPLWFNVDGWLKFFGWPTRLLGAAPTTTWMDRYVGTLPIAKDRCRVA